MAGRWAQLTVEAHIAHAIDYTKPVASFVERAVFDALELRKLVAKMQCYPFIDEDGHRVYVTVPSAERIFSAYMPDKDRVDLRHQASSASDPKAGIEFLKKYKAAHGMK